jgi:hypothetical protein
MGDESKSMAVLNASALSVAAMRKISMKELWVGWLYWSMVAVLIGFACLGLWGVIYGDTEDRSVMMGASVLFSGLVVCAIVWPILRVRERAGIQLEMVRFGEVNGEMVLIPTSRVKHSIFLAGSLLMGLGAFAILLQAHNSEYRAKGAIAAIARDHLCRVGEAVVGTEGRNSVVAARNCLETEL